MDNFWKTQNLHPQFGEGPICFAWINGTWLSRHGFGVLTGCRLINVLLYYYYYSRSKNSLVGGRYGHPLLSSEGLTSELAQRCSSLSLLFAHKSWAMHVDWCEKQQTAHGGWTPHKQFFHGLLLSDFLASFSFHIFILYLCSFQEITTWLTMIQFLSPKKSSACKRKHMMWKCFLDCSFHFSYRCFFSLSKQFAYDRFVELLKKIVCTTRSIWGKCHQSEKKIACSNILWVDPQ
jgi:hypothetical protein